MTLEFDKTGLEKRVTDPRADGVFKRLFRAFRAAIRPRRREDESQELMRRVIGWEGIKDAAGKDIPYSPEAAEALFRDVPNLLDGVDPESFDAPPIRSKHGSERRGT